jgi:hypothetical protein
MFIALFMAPLASAGPGVQEPVHPNYRNALDMNGLCTANRGNDKNHYWKSGHCQTIWETLTKNECTRQRVDEIRLRYLGDPLKLKAGKIKNKNGVKLGFECKGKNDPDQNMRKIAESSEKFNIIMMQLFAAIAIEQSNWRFHHGGSAQNSQAVRCTTNCGLLGINKADMEKPKYKCGCEIPNKTDDQKQYDPTMDGHLNLKCGITMALIEATKDEESESSLLGGGRKKSADNPKDTRSPFAKLFQSTEYVPTTTGPDVYDTPLKRIEGKIQSYCELEASATQNHRELVDKLQDGQQQNPLVPGTRDSTTSR